MAKPRKTAASASTPVLSDDDTDATPAPPAALHITPWTVPRKQLIDTEKDQYPNPRRWAEAIHAQPALLLLHRRLPMLGDAPPRLRASAPPRLRASATFGGVPRRGIHDN